MRIISINDLKKEWFEDFIRLGYVCFGEVFSLEQLRKLQEIEPKFSVDKSIYAIENSQLVGQVVVFDFEVNSKIGKMPAAGIAGVATLPRFSRRGIAKALMNAAHRNIAAAGIDLVFLFTGRTIVAHLLYESLGYSDIAYSRLGFKFLRKKPKSRVTFKSYNDKLQAKLFEIYSQQIKGMYGLVRSKRYLDLAKAKGLKNKDVQVAYINKQLIGYAVVKEGKKQLSVDEVYALKRVYISEIIKGIESKSKKDLIVIEVQPYLESIYKKLGYKIEEGYGVFMGKSLKGVSSEKIKDILGVRENKFSISSLDAF